MKTSACLVRSYAHDVVYMDGKNQFYLAVHNHTKNTRISATLFMTCRVFFFYVLVRVCVCVLRMRVCSCVNACVRVCR